MDEYFGPGAQEAIRFAQDEARLQGAPQIGTEHLLVGISRDIKSPVRKTFEESGITFDEVRHSVEEYVKEEYTEKVSAPVLEFSVNTKAVLRKAVEEANAMGSQNVDEVHIMVGILSIPDCGGVEVLNKLGVDRDSFRKKLFKFADVEDSGRYGASPESDTPALDTFGRDLTELAREGKLDPVIGREEEIERVVQILSRRKKNNPVLIGEPGVGKTAIVEGLALRIIERNIPELLVDKRIVAFDLASMIAGTKYRGEFEDRLKNLVDEVTESENVILFIDELHTIVGAGSAEGAMDAANILKPALARGDIQAIGATTLDEYRKYIEKDGALERRFQPVMVDENTIEETIEILEGLRDNYEEHHDVEISDEAIEAAAKLSARYITGRYLPDKAIDCIDEASAVVHLNNLVIPPDLKEMEDEISRLKEEIETAIEQQDFEKANKLHIEELELSDKLNTIKESWEEKKSELKDELVVRKVDVLNVISRWTGIPVGELGESEADKLLRMEEFIHKRLIDQSEAVASVSQTVRNVRAGLSDPKRPSGVFIFLGPTGVGKTELARTLAEFLYGSEEAIVRIDMSEYMERFSISRLIGAPPGYVGYEEGGQLTEKVRRKPYSVVLLDEIEKAHTDVFNLLLQVMDEGRLTDGQGRTVDFRNTLIIMTSNIGSDKIKKMSERPDFADDPRSYDRMKEAVMEDINNYFRPEFINRVDDIIIFKALTKEDLIEIVDIFIQEVRERLEEKDIRIKMDKGVKEFLAEKGYDPTFGARPLKRTIDRLITNPLANAILSGEFEQGDEVEVYLKDEEILFR